MQVQYQQQHEQQKKDLEILHQRNIQQLQNRLSELEVANKDLTERKYKGDSTVRELKAKLSGVEEVLNIGLVTCVGDVPLDLCKHLFGGRVIRSDNVQKTLRI